MNDGRVHLVHGPMCHWRLSSTGDGEEQGFVRGKNEIGDEQLKAGSFIGKKTCWRKSSSTVYWPE